MPGQHMASAQAPREPADRSTVMPIVFFDGGCALCRREIDHYRRVQGAGRIEWVDITHNTAVLAAYGLEPAAAMARLHVRDIEGRWQTGVWGFAELWSHLRGYRWLAWLLRATPVVPLLDLAYTRFARWRLRRRCSDGSCATPLGLRALNSNNPDGSSPPGNQN